MRGIQVGQTFDLLRPKQAGLKNLEAFSTPLDRIESFARSRGREVFAVSDHEKVVAVGTMEPHKVISIDGNWVELAASQARHEVVVAHGMKVGGSYELAIDPASNEILLVRDAVNGRELGTAAPNAAPLALAPITMDKARELFEVVQRQPHIPFDYPANGCWARAHEMCRLIEKYLDAQPTDIVGKTWNYGKLVVRSANTPACKVNWGYHVAPLVRADGKDLVLDPSMFDGPIEEGKWRAAQGDPAAKRAVTSRAVYYRNPQGGEFAEGPDETEHDMQDQRVKLFAQIYAHGPLPYKC